MSYHIDSHLDLHRLSHQDRCRDANNWHMVQEAKVSSAKKAGIISRMFNAVNNYRNSFSGRLANTSTKIELQTNQ